MELLMQTAIIVFAATIVLGFFVGILSSMLGIGGGVLMIPALRLLVGLDPVACAATTLTTIIITSLSGSIQRIRNKTCVPSVSLAIGIGGACMSPVGVWVASQSPDILIMIACAVCMFFAAYTAIRNALHPKSEEESLVMPEVQRKDLVKMFFVGMLVGLAAGYVGLGGGFIIMPFLVGYMHFSMKMASGTSLLAVMILAIPAAITQIVFGNVVWLVCIGLAIGAIPGSIVGARRVKVTKERTLSVLLGSLLIVVGAMLIVNELI